MQHILINQPATVYPPSFTRWMDGSMDRWMDGLSSVKRMFTPPRAPPPGRIVPKCLWILCWVYFIGERTEPRAVKCCEKEEREDRGWRQCYCKSNLYWERHTNSPPLFLLPLHLPLTRPPSPSFYWSTCSQQSFRQEGCWYMCITGECESPHSNALPLRSMYSREFAQLCSKSGNEDAN